MNLNRAININQKLELLAPGSGNVYATRVEDLNFNEPPTLTVSWPTNAAELLNLRPGDLLKVHWVSSRGEFWADVRVRTLVSQPVPFLVLEILKPVTRVQRRTYGRIEVNLRVKFCVLSHIDESGKPFDLEGKAVELSGGGLKLVSPIQLDNGAILDMMLMLPDRRLHLVGKVLRKLREELPLVAVEFIGIDENDRDVICRYVIQEERRRRAKGLLG